MIPIKNIYYMLCYAWKNTLKQEGESLLDKEAFENIYNLLSAILIQEVSRLIKGGIGRGYVECSEELSLVRGKINLDTTIKNQALTRKKIVCDYDEFSENIIINRILKSTMAILFKYPELDKKYRIKMKKLLRNFSNVDEIDLSYINWQGIN